MAQLPDDSSNLIPTVVATLTGVITAIAGAYAVVRKSRVDTKKEASELANATVQSTLDAMKIVIDGLTKELSRRQDELAQLRREIDEERVRTRALERKNTELERKADRLENRLQRLQGEEK